MRPARVALEENLIRRIFELNALMVITRAELGGDNVSLPRRGCVVAARLYETLSGFGGTVGHVTQGSRSAALRGNPGLSYESPSG